jgi:hypothetical protein
MANDLIFGRADGGSATVVGVGTAASGAAAIVESTNFLTSETGQTAFILPAKRPVGAPITLRVGTVAALIFPPTGGKINGGTTDASISATAAKTCVMIPINDGTGLNWMSLQGA